VVVLADYGAFVEIAPGVEGLDSRFRNVVEPAPAQRSGLPESWRRSGSFILTLDRDERKMSLGIKQLEIDPWEKIEDTFGVGSKHKATVRNFTNFGVFVEITEGVDGLNPHFGFKLDEKNQTSIGIYSNWRRN
jgi:small subunit ribosomal protein S1